MASLLTRFRIAQPYRFSLLNAITYCTVNDKIAKMVEGRQVVVFMKGTPEQPNCGFSNAVCQILKFHGVDNFTAYDVLADEAVRQGVKDYTSWPTIPQVFLAGEFIGGCDILLEMHKSGELIDELAKLGIRSALLDEAVQ